MFFKGRPAVPALLHGSSPVFLFACLIELHNREVLTLPISRRPRGPQDRHLITIQPLLNVTQKCCSHIVRSLAMTEAVWKSML